MKRNKILEALKRFKERKSKTFLKSKKILKCMNDQFVSYL